MLLDDYFQEIRELADGCPIVESSNLVYEARSRDRGFLRGELKLVDGSVLCVREFIKITTEVIREMYVYQ